MKIQTNQQKQWYKFIWEKKKFVEEIEKITLTWFTLEYYVHIYSSKRHLPWKLLKLCKTLTSESMQNCEKDWICT